MMQKTLVLLKPDAVKRSVSGEIIQRFERAGLKIVGMKMILINDEFAKKHYCDHIGKDFYKCLEQFITSGPVIAICLEGINAIEIVRKNRDSKKRNCFMV
jgi:nucleoside-diphosphate kinase